MSIAFLFIGVIAALLGMFLFFINRSPAGYQDENGFHFGYQYGGALPKTENFLHPVLSARQKIQVEKECSDPFTFLRFPWLFRGFGLTALLVSLVILPKSVQNTDKLAVQDSASTIHQQINLSDVDFVSENGNEAVLAINTITTGTDSKFLPQLCLRFSEVQ